MEPSLHCIHRAGLQTSTLLLEEVSFSLLSFSLQDYMTSKRVYDPYAILRFYLIWYMAPLLWLIWSLRSETVKTFLTDGKNPSHGWRTSNAVQDSLLLLHRICEENVTTFTG